MKLFDTYVNAVCCLDITVCLSAVDDFGSIASRERVNIGAGCACATRELGAFLATKNAQQGACRGQRVSGGSDNRHRQNRKSLTENK